MTESPAAAAEKADCTALSGIVVVIMLTTFSKV